MAHLGAQDVHQALIEVMMQEAIKTSEIEGEYISRPDVMSSIKAKLDETSKHVKVHDKRALGIVDMMFDVRQSFHAPLTDTQLFEWHIMLMSASFHADLQIGTWRTHDEPMQIVSRKGGRWKVHYEAPPSTQVPMEMARFINWFNETSPNQAKAIKFAPIRAAIAHLYFECIHPFEDGNGRIGRAIAEKALSQGYGHPVLLSLSKAIESDKKRYYKELNKASFDNNITDWIAFFIDIILKAQDDIDAQLNFVINKAKFFDTYSDVLNDRQLKVIRKMMSFGPTGFEGGMSAKKYIKIADTSKATATRDLQHLATLGIIKAAGKGRSVHYELVLNPKVD